MCSLVIVVLVACSCSAAGPVANGTPPPDDGGLVVREAGESLGDRDEAAASSDRAVADTPDIPIEPGTSLTERRSNQRAAVDSQPVGLVIDSLSIEAPIVPVGVESNGEMEIPGAAEVGWYRFGSRPGEEGSAVLAAHVDYDGRVGVFFELAGAEVGAFIEIERSDGSTSRFVVTERAQFEKNSLPFDEIFRRDGSPALVLITCGGDFNPSLRSYEDNVVVFATPVDT